jgi:hypothetical protein
MGYYTHFSGVLEFTLRLKKAELDWLEKVLEAGQYDNDDRETESALDAYVMAQHKADGGKGPVIYNGPDNAEFRARHRGFITGDGFSAQNAGDLSITDDRRGLCYTSEKSYNLVGGVNFIIVNARTRIPNFGLKGQLRADTEFAPYRWWLRIGPDGMALQVPIKAAQPSAWRRLAQRIGLG